MKILVVTLFLLFAGALTAEATQYAGWADTGWSYYDKSECCAEAIAEAEDDSAWRCEAAGGWPQGPSRGQRRGSCRWRWRHDERGDRMYRCQATAKLRCK